MFCSAVRKLEFACQNSKGGSKETIHRYKTERKNKVAGVTHYQPDFRLRGIAKQGTT